MYDSYNYPERESRFREAVQHLEGQTLTDVKIQNGTPEINVVYLGFGTKGVAIQGDIGGEVLMVVPIDNLSVEIN